MPLSDIVDRGLVLLGCGKMGSAMLAGWLADGLPPSSVWIVDPDPSEYLTAQKGLHLNAPLPENPAVVIIAVKPQVMASVLPVLGALGNADTLFISVAAGIQMDNYERMLGAKTPIIRAMPNLPAAIGQGITALVANAQVTDAQTRQGEDLLGAVGQTVWLTDEAQIDAVTGVSGSGPGYVFHMIEALAAAGEAQGLPAELSLALAKATVAGAGAMALDAAEDPGQLRQNVSSPGGTTLAGLAVLMDPDKGLKQLMNSTVSAAANRSRELTE